MCCSDSVCVCGGVLSGEGWLICHRSSFQSLLCTAAHLDADVRQLASCVKPVLLSVEERGPGTKGSCIFLGSFYFYLFIYLYFLVVPCSASASHQTVILLDSMSSQSPVPPPQPSLLVLMVEHKDGGRRGIQRGSSGVSDIDITSVIIKPKLAK